MPGVRILHPEYRKWAGSRLHRRREFWYDPQRMLQLTLLMLGFVILSGLMAITEAAVLGVTASEVGDRRSVRAYAR